MKRTLYLHAAPHAPSVLRLGRRQARGCAVTLAVAMLLFCGCNRAPDYSILGSYFPVWLLCGVAGILLSFGVHLLVRRMGWEEQLAPPLLVYPSMAAAFCMVLWLALFS